MESSPSKGSDAPRFTLATLQTPTGPKAAMGLRDKYYILSEIAPSHEHATVTDLLRDWTTSFAWLEALAGDISNRGSSGLASSGAERAISTEEAQLLTPVMYPNKLMAVGANYSGHLKEMGLAVEKWAPMPFFFRPPTTSLVGPGETVRIPPSTKQFDWECELAVVVGKTLRHASKEEAADAIMGYTIGLDMSCRDLIIANNELKIDLVRGKAQDTMAPCGPVIVPKQFMPDVNNLRIQLAVNGKTMIDASTEEMMYKCDEQLSIISEHITVEPGDILFTGSPAGSAGVHGNCWLKPGDKIKAEIDGIGVLDLVIRKD